MPHSLFRELYKEELQRRETLRNSVTIPLGLLSVVAGFLGTLVAEHPIRQQLEDYVFWIAAGITFYLLVRGAYYLARSYHGHKYRVLSAKKLRSDFDAIKAWHDYHGDSKGSVQDDSRVAPRMSPVHS